MGARRQLSTSVVFESVTFAGNEVAAPHKRGGASISMFAAHVSLQNTIVTRADPGVAECRDEWDIHERRPQSRRATRPAASPGPRISVGVDPLLGPLADNGGPTPTHGAARGQPGPGPRQLRGSQVRWRRLPRIYDDPGLPNATGGDGSDIGAFELHALETPTFTPPSVAVRVPVAVCQHAVTLLDVVAISRGRVRVTGLARRAYTGRAVAIARDGKPVATAVIAGDGRDRRCRRDHHRRLGRAGALHRDALRRDPLAQLPARALVHRRTPRQVTPTRMRITARLRGGGRRVVAIEHQTSCNARTTIARKRTTRDGRLTFSLPRPPATSGDPYAIYRLRATLGKGRSYSVQITIPESRLSRMKPLRAASTTALLALLAVALAPAATHAATLTVTTAADTGATSLRAAIAVANSTAGPDEITFAAAVTGAIELQSPLPAISSELTIQGPGADVLAVTRTTGAPDFRILTLTGAANARVAGLTISGGLVTGTNMHGGGIDVASGGTLVLSGTVVRDNAVVGTGGDGRAEGGGVYATNASVTILDSTITANAASATGTGGFGPVVANGGGVYVVSGSRSTCGAPRSPPTPSRRRQPGRSSTSAAAVSTSAKPSLLSTA